MSRSRSRSRSPDRGAARDSAPQGEEVAKLFIGNLSFETQERDLEDAFSRYGKVVEARVITDRDTGRPKGFGFVTFESAASAEDAVAGMSGFELQGREIRVDKATPKGAGPGPRRDSGGRGGFGGGGDRNCHDFARGNCKYGDSCKFSHGDSGGGGGGDRRGGYDDRRGGGRDDYRGGGRNYDDRRGGGRDYDDRRGGGRDYDDRRGGGRDYDDRRGGGRDDHRGGRDDYRGGRDSEKTR